MATPALELDPERRSRDDPSRVAVATAIADAAQQGSSVLANGSRRSASGRDRRRSLAYPDARLTAIAMPPHVLFVRGEIGALERDRAAAVVGTRRATDRGRTIAGRIATRAGRRRGDRRVGARVRHRRRRPRGHHRCRRARPWP